MPTLNLRFKFAWRITKNRINQSLEFNDSNEWANQNCQANNSYKNIGSAKCKYIPLYEGSGIPLDTDVDTDTESNEHDQLPMRESSIECIEALSTLIPPSPKE